MFHLLVGLIFVVQADSALKVSRFTQADVHVRREMIRSAAANIDQAQQDDVILLIEAGLKDSDAQVRFSAIDALTQVIMRIGRSTRTNVRELDTRSLRPLEPVLVRTLEDADFRIRGGAARALGFIASESDAAARAALVSLYAREPQGSVRAAVIADLGRTFRGVPEVQDLAVAALTDGDETVRGQAAMIVAQFRPGAALPQIVAELQGGNENTRAAFVKALSSYGPAARPYVSILERLLAIETREGYREQLRQAIVTIQESRP